MMIFPKTFLAVGLLVGCGAMAVSLAQPAATLSRFDGALIVPENFSLVREGRIDFDIYEIRDSDGVPVAGAYMGFAPNPIQSIPRMDHSCEIFIEDRADDGLQIREVLLHTPEARPQYIHLWRVVEPDVPTFPITLRSGTFSCDLDF